MTCPSEELFDVVDAHNRVIDVKPRSEVHRMKLRHRAVHVFLFRSDDCLLLHLRSADKEEFPGVWTSSAAGHLSTGERYAESAARELQEELGVIAPVTKVGECPACPETSNEFTELFVATSDGTIVPDPIEISQIRWLPPADVQQWLSDEPQQFSPAFGLLFRQWFKADRLAAKRKPS